MADAPKTYVVSVKSDKYPQEVEKVVVEASSGDTIEVDHESVETAVKHANISICPGKSLNVVLKK